MRAITATIMVLACVALLYVLWDAAWRALSDLPSMEDVQKASARVTKTVSVAPQPPAERSAPPAKAPPNSSNSNVRFIEKDGIVGIHVDGPLERAPSAVKIEPPPPPPKDEPDLYRLVVIESAGLIDVRSHKVRLAHVNTPATEATCRNAQGTAWPCGMRARTAMRRLVRRRTIECLDAKDGAEPTQTADAGEGATRTDAAPKKGEIRTAVCKSGNTELSEWLLENGWAAPTNTTPDDWRALYEEAKAVGRGMYDPNGR